MIFLINFSRVVQVVALLIVAGVLGDYLGTADKALWELSLVYLFLFELAPIGALLTIDLIFKLKYGAVPDTSFFKSPPWLTISGLLFFVCTWLSYRY